MRIVTRKQRAYIGWHLPSPDALVLIAQEGTRLWEREMGDMMAMQVRLGTSSQSLAMEAVDASDRSFGGFFIRAPMTFRN